MKETARRHKCDWWILGLTFALLIIGLILLYAIGSMYAKAQGPEENQYFVKQSLISLAAVVIFFIVYKLPYKISHRVAVIVALLALFCSILLLVAKWAGWGIASCGGGQQCRWLNLGFFSFQPSEVMKIALVIYLADFLEQKKQKKEVGTGKFWVQIVLISVVCLGLVVWAQGDLGTGIIIALIILGMLYMAGISRKSLLIVIGIAVVGVVIFAVLKPYRLERVTTWLEVWDGILNNTLTINDANRQAVNALIALGSGGMFGVGIGNSIQATGWLSESVNDSIFAIIGETFGFFGTMVVLIMFAILLWRILGVAKHTSDFRDCTTTIGIFIWLMAQIFLNIASMILLTPMTGITLPLISYGGTSVVVVMAGIALVLRFSCYTSKEGIKDENISSGRGVRGSRYTSSRRRA